MPGTQEIATLKCDERNISDSALIFRISFSCHKQQFLKVYFIIFLFYKISVLQFFGSAGPKLSRFCFNKGTRWLNTQPTDRLSRGELCFTRAHPLSYEVHRQLFQLIKRRAAMIMIHATSLPQCNWSIAIKKTEALVKQQISAYQAKEARIRQHFIVD